MTFHDLHQISHKITFTPIFTQLHGHNNQSSTSFSPHLHILQSFHCVTLALAVPQRWRFRKARSLPPWWPGKPATKPRKKDQKKMKLLGSYTLPTKMVLYSTVNYKKQHFLKSCLKGSTLMFLTWKAPRELSSPCLRSCGFWKFRRWLVVAKSIKI